MRLISDFLSLFYPENCVACRRALYLHENEICNQCFVQLPKTGFYALRNNAVEQLFWGRTPVYSAAAYLYFHKGSRVQKILHALKYSGRIGVGLVIGERFGEHLMYEPAFNTCQGIIPVPLHKKKEKERGYNQSLCFAQGLSKKMKIPVLEKSLIRTEYTGTQTKNTKFSRWENVESLFQCRDKKALSNKHLLLVDDVITTGATLEACCSALMEVPGIKISIASIAFA